MFRREMCGNKTGIEVRRQGLAARREEQRNKLLENRRKVDLSTSEKKVVPTTKPKESAEERRARLQQYRQMKTLKDAELRNERMKTPAFKVGPAPSKGKNTPAIGTARKMLNFDFTKNPSSESSSAFKTPASRKALNFSTSSTSTQKLERNAVTSNFQMKTRNLVRGATESNMKADTNKRTAMTPQKSSLNTPSVKGGVTAARNTVRTTPKVESKLTTPSRIASSRITPSKATNFSTTTKSQITQSSSTTTRTTPLKTQPRTPAKTVLTSEAATTRANPTPQKPPRTPLKSAETKTISTSKLTTPSRTPLANRFPTTTPRTRIEPKNEEKSQLKNRTVTSTKLTRAQSSNNLSRPEPHKSAAKPVRVPQSKTPQIKLQRSASATNLPRKVLASPASKTQSNATKSTDGKTTDDEKPKVSQKLNLRSNSALSSSSLRNGAISRFQAIVRKKQNMKLDLEQETPECDDSENDKKWADLLAHIRAQKNILKRTS